MLPFRTILHATDFSTLAHHAYDVARAFARDFGARLVVVHVAEVTHVAEEPVVLVELPIPAPPRMTGDVSQQGYHEALRERLRELHPSDPEVTVETCLREGTPADEILRLADEIACDLIVIGTHGRTSLERMIMGSVAEAIIRRAHCPVMTVRSPFPSPGAETDATDHLAATV